MNRVLIVDDNPMILRLLQQALTPLATVTAVASGDAALAQAATQPPDLILTDYQMPGMDGVQLLRELKINVATARVPVILMAARSDLNERLQSLRESVEDFLEKPFFVREVTARIKRILDKIALEKMAHDTPGETVVRGSLAQMGVIDLLQSLELGRKTCALLLIGEGGDRCEIFFEEGQIRHATYGSLSGDEAVYKVLTWMEPTGSFQIDFSRSSSVHTTTRSTQGLLMEGLRLLDEANREAVESEN